MRALNRLSLVVIVAAAIFVGYDTFLPPLPDYGLRATKANRPFAEQQVASVAPNSPAARAGIRAGDTVSFGASALARAEAQYVLPGTSVSATVNRTRTVALVAPAVTFSTILLLPLIIRLAFLAVAGLLAWRRPDDPSARALVLFLLCFGLLIGLDNTVMPTPLLSVIVLQTGSTILLLLGAGAAATFAANFPSGVAQPVPRALARIAQVLVAAAIAMTLLGTWLARSPSFNPAVFGVAVVWLFVAIVALLLAILVVAYVQGAPSERQRRRWVFLMLGLGLLAVLIDIGVQMTAGYSALVDNASLLFIGAIPFGLAYVILRHRVIDVGFVINRAVVYGAVSIIIVAIFVIVETLASNFVERHSRAGSIALQLTVALVLGFSIRAIHARVDRAVDRLLFRQRHLDEAAIADFTHDAHYITDAAVLLDRCVETAIRHGHAVRAGIWPRDYPDVDENDPALVAMRARRVVADLRAAGSALPGAIAFPMIVRGELTGALVCGNKTQSEAYAPDEKEGLRNMAAAVGHALDGLRVRELEERVRLLESAQPLHA